jgi:hypothetical protein
MISGKEKDLDRNSNLKIKVEINLKTLTNYVLTLAFPIESLLGRTNLTG